MTLLEDIPSVLDETGPGDDTSPVRHDPRAGVRSRAASRSRRTIGVLLRLTGLAAAMTVIGIFCVTPDGTGFVQGLDSRLSRLLRVAAVHPTQLSRQVGAPVVVLIASAAVSCVMWRRRTSVVANLAPMIACAAAALVAWVPAVLVRRPGPGHLGDLSAASATSFPSMSAAMLTALACAIVGLAGSRGRAWSWLALVIVTAFPSLVRLATGASWPLDEVFGALIGWRAALVLRRSAGRERARSESDVRRRRRALVGLTTIAVVVAGLCARSYAQILEAPGNAAFDQRTVEWLRSNGLGPLVDRGESWWLWRHLPSPTDTIAALPLPPVNLVGPDMGKAGRTILPQPMSPPVRPALPREGQWTVAARDSAGRVEIATTDLRPDPSHPSIVAAVVWINSATTKIGLVAGTREPGGGLGPSGGHVPPAELPTVLAAFNSGYKMEDTPGGTLIEGRTTRPMVDGLATLAIRPDGTATVGSWGGDLTSAGGYVGLRQNLRLMVIGGAVVPGLPTNHAGRWGSVRNTLPTWRSGLGVTADGNLVYVAGDHLTLSVLGETLVHAGAVTAMELDIHRGMVTFNLFTHVGRLVGHKLLPTMHSSPDRYLTTDWRDFVTVVQR
ncbi:MAG: hypothetical protein JWN62_425 [Acidimicrobiales bacterium]|nr:hypothetical protein [Acidimicrobiales bacterium]